MLNPEKVIFITGVMRSGTTLLYQLLTEAIPDSNTSGPEFHKLYFLLRTYKNLKFIPLSKGIFKFISLKILESHSNGLGRPDKLIIKDPFIVRYFHLLEILLPESTHIVIVRNPFVNINSILRVRKKQLDKGQNTKLTRYSKTQVVRYFNLLSKNLFNQVNSSNRLIIRYEDLVSKDLDTLRILESKIHHPISLNKKSQPAFDKDNPFYSDLYDKPISLDSINNQELITNELRSLISEECGDYIKRFNY